MQANLGMGYDIKFKDGIVAGNVPFNGVEDV
jgi:hypothetical protein